MIRCQNCNKQFEENALNSQCPSCGGILTALDSESTFDFTYHDNPDTAATIDVGLNSKTFEGNESTDKTVVVGLNDATMFSVGSTVESFETADTPPKHDSESTISLGSLDLPSLPIGSELTIDVDAKPSTDGTIDFSIDNFSGSRD
jgi:hypothetical protein